MFYQPVKKLVEFKAKNLPGFSPSCDHSRPLPASAGSPYLHMRHPVSGEITGETNEQRQT
jgi:hypothetical protein